MIFTLKLYKVCIETILQYILLVCYNYSCFLLCQTYLINQYIITLFTGTLSSLKHHKNEVDIIKKDSECGISLSENSVQYRRGDVIVCYKTIEIKPKIDWDPGF
jgi:hypothetical protein